MTDTTGYTCTSFETIIIPLLLVILRGRERERGGGEGEKKEGEREKEGEIHVLNLMSLVRYE